MTTRAIPQRCPWARNAMAIRYHDEEWGVPVHDDSRLFEMLTLEGAQAGLSWDTILAKREGYRRVFLGFDADRVARMNESHVEQLVRDPSIVRHRGKIESVLSNARALLTLRDEAGSFADWLWSRAEGATVVNRWRRLEQVPSETDASRELSRELKRRGFRFVGPTTCYAFMQAAGFVDDHLVDCFRHGVAAAS